MKPLPEKFLKLHTSEPYVITDYINVDTAWEVFYPDLKSRMGAWKRIQKFPENIFTIFVGQSLIPIKTLNEKYEDNAIYVPVKEGQIAVSVHDFYDADAVRKLYGSDRLADVIKRNVLPEEACGEFWRGKAVRKDYLKAHYLTIREQLEESAKDVYAEDMTEEQRCAYEKGLENNILFPQKAEIVRIVLKSYHEKGRDDLNYYFMRGVFQKNTCEILQSFASRKHPLEVDLKEKPRKISDTY